MLQYFWPHIILDTCTQYTFNIICKKKYNTYKIYVHGRGPPSDFTESVS